MHMSDLVHFIDSLASSKTRLRRSVDPFREGPTTEALFVSLPSLLLLVLVAIPISSVLLLAPGRGRAESCERLELDRILPRIVPEIDSYSLPNGLRVHLVPRADERSVTVRIGYDVGARDEAPDRSGVAHLFEHMMFKGSEQIPDGGHFRLVRDVGGRTNAETDYDTTQYWNTVPSAALPRVLFAEADRLRGIRITDANLANQRASIQEEGLGLANLPYVAAATEFGLELWSGTPYGHSPIGSDAELAAMDESEARRFHADYYTPSNAVLVVVGGFEPRSARAAIERSFGSIPPGHPRPPRNDFEVDRRPIRRVIDDPLAPFPLYAVVWHGVGSRNDDALVLSVLDSLLMGYPDARLERAIRGSLVIDAYSVSFALRDVGLLNIAFAPRTFASFEDIQQAMERVVEPLRQDGPTSAELCKSLRSEQSKRLAALGTNEGVAAAIVRGSLIQDDPRFFEEELRRLDSLQSEDIKSAAREYLVPDYSTLEIRPAGVMRWLKPILEVLPSGVGSSLEGMLL